MNTEFLITDVTYDELYDEAYERVAMSTSDAYAMGEIDSEEVDEAEVHDMVDELYLDSVTKIYDGEDLRHWWANNGWTLDRGYGGPNYKERILAETNFDLIYDVMCNMGNAPDEIFGLPVYTSTEANDMVLFLEDDLEEDYPEEDYEEDFLD